MRGGSLASDLTHVYARYRDQALDLRLKHRCSPETTTRPAEERTRVTDAESFALRGFLRVAGGAMPSRAIPSETGLRR
jgi:hypothetical protein